MEHPLTSSPADELLKNKTEIGKALRAIAEGYPVRGEQDRYIVVENPEFERNQDWGPNPNLVIDVYPILDLLRCMGTNI